MTEKRTFTPQRILDRIMPSDRAAFKNPTLCWCNDCGATYLMPVKLFPFEGDGCPSCGGDTGSWRVMGFRIKNAITEVVGPYHPGLTAEDYHPAIPVARAAWELQIREENDA